MHQELIVGYLVLTVYCARQEIFSPVIGFEFVMRVIEQKQVKSVLMCSQRCLKNQFCVSFTCCQFSSMQCHLHDDESLYQSNTTLSQLCTYYRMKSIKQVPGNYLHRNNHCGQQTKAAIISKLNSLDITVPLHFWDKQIQTSCKKLKEIRLGETRLYNEIKYLSKGWCVSLDIKPTRNYNGMYNSIIHITNGGDQHAPGDRNPAIWFLPNSTSVVVHWNNVDGMVTNPFHANVYTNMMMTNYEYRGKYFFTVHVNQSEIFRVENLDTGEFNDVRVYIVDPWYGSSEGFGSIRNFVYFNL